MTALWFVCDWITSDLIALRLIHHHFNTFYYYRTCNFLKYRYILCEEYATYRGDFKSQTKISKQFSTF